MNRDHSVVFEIASKYCISAEKAMAPHSSTLAWRIPERGGPGGLPSIGSHRVGHDWSDLAALNCISGSCWLWLPGDAGRYWGQEEKGMTEDEMAGWHHWLDGCWIWVNSGRWWWTGRPGMLQFMGLQRVGHDWATELNWSEVTTYFSAIMLVKPSF